jgi:preprotein translocase subunit Sec61beta
MADSSIQMPSGMGGLMRYSDEYESRFPISPVHVIGFVILIIGLRIALSIFFKQPPIA